MTNVKRSFIPILIIGTFVPTIALARANEILGNWARADGIAHVSVTQCGDSYCARNIWVGPNRNNEKVGDVLIMTIRETTRGGYQGTAYDPQRKLKLRFRLNVNGDNMATHGCLLGGLLCKSADWRRL